MIKITYENKVYNLDERKVLFVLEKLCKRKVTKDEIEYYLANLNLYDKHFFENVNKL